MSGGANKTPSIVISRRRLFCRAKHKNSNTLDNLLLLLQISNSVRVVAIANEIEKRVKKKTEK